MDGLYKIHNKMSWSITVSGTPQGVVTAIENESNNLSGQSKEEYDSTMPILISMIKDCRNEKILLNASGHGFRNDNEKYTDKSFSVNIRHFE